MCKKLYDCISKIINEENIVYTDNIVRTITNTVEENVPVDSVECNPNGTELKINDNVDVSIERIDNESMRLKIRTKTKDKTKVDEIVFERERKLYSTRYFE